jgi:DNA invertase Pin-like site-specific DNA recombinase
MRAVGYARVSTDQQGANGLGMESQRECIARECERRGWQLVTICSDVASGRSQRGRDGFATALATLEAGDADVLVVCKLDRLARSLVDFASLLEHFNHEGWQLVVLDLGVDMTTPAGEMVASIMAALAQWERRMISERTRTALAERKRQGLPVGAPVSQAMRDPKTLALVKDLRAQRMSLRGIAAELSRRGVPAPAGGSWNHESVRKAVLAD